MTNIRRIDLNLLTAFDALYDLRSVTSAAERLSLTQPTVSGMLARLRDLFDDPLFIRTQYGVSPTPRADTLSHPIKTLLTSVAELIAPQDFKPETAEITLSISANDYLQDALLAPLIAQLRKRAPGVRVAVLPAYDKDLFDRLARGELDLAVTVPGFADERLPREFLYTERYVCVARAEHPLTAGALSMEEFCAFDHILMSPTGGSFSGPTDDVLRERRTRRRVAISVPSFHVLLRMLKADDFFAMVPSRFLSGHLNGMKQFEPPVAPPDFDVVSCWHPRLAADPAQRWVRSQLREAAQLLNKVSETAG